MRLRQTRYVARMEDTRMHTKRWLEDLKGKDSRDLGVYEMIILKVLVREFL
jgi:hypothetical protein